jgi:hypothetical protein
MKIVLVHPLALAKTFLACSSQVRLVIGYLSFINQWKNTNAFTAEMSG